MFALLFGNPVALALVCDIGDVACTDANTLRDRINTLQPGAVADDHPKSNRRTARIRDTLQTLYDLAAADGCTMNGLSAFRYANGESVGDWTRGGDTGTAASTYANQVILGTYAGDASGTLGDFGIYAGMKVALEWDAADAYVGRFIRIRGRRGVGFAAIGSCPGAVQDVFEPFLPELSGIVDPEPPVATGAGAGFLRVQALDAAAGGSSASASYTMAFTLGGATTPAEGGATVLNPSLPVP